MVKKVSQKDIKILVVDDNVQTAVNVAGFLSLKGFKTLEAYTFSGAIETAKKEKPSLIVADILLDKNTAYDLAEMLPNYKFILMTAYSEQINQKKKYKNILAILQKPLNNFELLVRIKKLFKISLTEEEKSIELGLV